MTETPKPDDPSASILAGLFKLGLVLRHQSWKASGERGRTPTQSQVLARLAQLEAGVGVKRIAAELAITVGTASEAISALERKGLLTKAPSPADGRAIVLKLTRKGRREAARSMEWPEVLVQAVDDISAPEQAGLQRGLVGLIRSLQERGAVPMSRMCVDCRFFRPNEHAGEAKPHHCDYLDAPIGDASLQVDCPDMEPAAEDLRPALWAAFIGAGPSPGGAQA